MRDRIKFIWSTPQADGSGGWKPGETQEKEVWADLDSASGRRAMENTKIEHTTAYEVTMRYQPGFTPTPDMKVEVGGQALTIHGRPDSRPHLGFIKFTCHG